MLCFAYRTDLIKSLFHAWKEGLLLTLFPSLETNLSHWKFSVLGNVHEDKIYQEKKKLAFTAWIKPSWEWLTLTSLISFVTFNTDYLTVSTTAISNYRFSILSQRSTTTQKLNFPFLAFRVVTLMLRRYLCQCLALMSFCFALSCLS